MSECKHEWRMKPEANNLLIVARCIHCDIAMGASVAEICLNEYATPKEEDDKVLGFIRQCKQAGIIDQLNALIEEKKR